MSDYTVDVTNESHTIQIETSIDCATCSSVEVTKTQPSNIGVATGFAKEDVFATDIIALDIFVAALGMDGGTP